MSASSYDECLRRLLIHEGGYSNHPADPGGPTNFGITIADYRKYVKPDATAADVKAMRVEEAKAVYRAKYWNGQRCDELPPGVDDSIFDYGVNSGTGRSGKVLRRLVGQPDNTSVINADVIAAVNRRDKKQLIAAINDERLAFLRSLKTWPVFGDGWSRRVAEVRAFSLALASAVPDPVPAPSTVTGKGIVPAPNTKPVIAAGAVVAASAGGVLHWIGAHPAQSIFLVILLAALIAVIVGAINSNAKSKQTAGTSGATPVPVKG